MIFCMETEVIPKICFGIGIIDNPEKKFGGTWYVCAWGHLKLVLTFQEYKNPDVQNRIIDESQAGDMYEIQAGMGAYI